jgi:hypothetical protein
MGKQAQDVTPHCRGVDYVNSVPAGNAATGINVHVEQIRRFVQGETELVGPQIQTARKVSLLIVTVSVSSLRRTRICL